MALIVYGDRPALEPWFGVQEPHLFKLWGNVRCPFSKPLNLELLCLFIWAETSARTHKLGEME